MTKNKLKSPFYLSRDTQTRPIIGITDIVMGRALTVGHTEYPAGTDLESVLNKGDQRNYKVYTALLTQSSTSAPVATILENTLGNVVWGYTSAGVYTATLVGAFPAATTYYTKILDVVEGEVNLEGVLKANRTSNDVITIYTDATNGLLSATPIEIRSFIVIDDINGG